MPAKIRHRHARKLLLQDRDDLLFAEPVASHFRPTPLRRTLLKILHILGEHIRAWDNLAEPVDSCANCWLVSPSSLLTHADRRRPKTKLQRSNGSYQKGQKWTKIIK
jgi:hypothetical protein